MFYVCVVSVSVTVTMKREGAEFHTAGKDLMVLADSLELPYLPRIVSSDNRRR